MSHTWSDIMTAVFFHAKVFALCHIIENVSITTRFVSLEYYCAGQDITYTRSKFTVVYLCESSGICSNCVIFLRHHSVRFVAIHISFNSYEFSMLIVLHHTLAYDSLRRH